MNFFDSLITDVNNNLCSFSKKSYAFDLKNKWEDAGQNELVLQRETAFELDGIGFNLVTSTALNSDEIIVIGEDLNCIHSDTSFARISMIQIDDVFDDQQAYDLIRKIEYVKYHYFPKGYMIRTASRSHKEVVRVSKTALQSGVSFEKIGNLLISKYRENQSVKNVKLIFITEKSIDYKYLEALAKKNHAITETLNHIMNSVNFDCSTCNLKPICDEVDGMKELHFKNKMNNA